MDDNMHNLTETVQISLAEENSPPTKENGAQDMTNITPKRRIVPILALQFLIAIDLFLFNWFYGMFHNVPSFVGMFLGDDLGNINSRVAAYNFIGVTSPDGLPSFYAIFIEVFFWSSAGVLARSEYYLTQIIILHKNLGFLETLSKVIADCAMGVSIAMAVIAFLQSTQFLNLTLKGSNIETIAAISFIFGFYHEDARRLLGGFQKRVSGVAMEIKEIKKE